MSTEPERFARLFHFQEGQQFRWFSQQPFPGGLEGADVRREPERDALAVQRPLAGHVCLVVLLVLEKPGVVPPEQQLEAEGRGAFCQRDCAPDPFQWLCCLNRSG